MDRIRIAAALLGAALVSAPALAQDAPPPAVAAPAVAPATTGRVYIAYPQDPRATFPSQLSLNGAWSSNSVAPGSCEYFDLPPGSYKLATLSTTKLDVDVALGDAKYVELQIRKESFGDQRRDTTTPKLVDKPADTSTCQHADAPGL
ncbi:MAG: hypothetical protein WDM91_01190 [Rhizomicrobium sp.]